MLKIQYHKICVFSNKIVQILEFEEKFYPINLGIEFRKRPLPYDFPAFAHEKPVVELGQPHQSGEILEKPTEGSDSEKMRQICEHENIEDIMKKK